MGHLVARKHHRLVAVQLAAGRRAGGQNSALVAQPASGPASLTGAPQARSTHTLTMLPTVWSSLCTVNVPALATFVSRPKAILWHMAEWGPVSEREHSAVDDRAQHAAATHFFTPSGTTNFS